MAPEPEGNEGRGSGSKGGRKRENGRPGNTLAEQNMERGSPNTAQRTRLGKERGKAPKRPKRKT